MTLGKQHASARALLEDCRSQQRQILQAAWDDDYRTLTDDEAEQYERLAKDIGALELEVRRLYEVLEMDAATAVPPNANPDWRPA